MNLLTSKPFLKHFSRIRIRICFLSSKHTDELKSAPSFIKILPNPVPFDNENHTSASNPIPYPEYFPCQNQFCF